jgi:hypothetical protein
MKDELGTRFCAKIPVIEKLPFLLTATDIDNINQEQRTQRVTRATKLSI